MSGPRLTGHCPIIGDRGVYYSLWVLLFGQQAFWREQSLRRTLAKWLASWWSLLLACFQGYLKTRSTDPIIRIIVQCKTLDQFRIRSWCQLGLTTPSLKNIPMFTAQILTSNLGVKASKASAKAPVTISNLRFNWRTLISRQFPLYETHEMRYDYSKSFPCYPLITYYWTLPLILDHSYLLGRLTSSKIADT
jgi:hypothetical protein